MIQRLLSLFVTSLCLAHFAQAQPGEQFVAQSGNCTLTPRTMLCHNPQLAPLVSYLQEYIPLSKASDSMSANEAIVLTTDPTLAEEGYRLTVKPQRIEISGGSYGGVFNGIQALFRLMPKEVYAKTCTLPLHVPCGEVESAPRFAYRGMMLDVARTWVDGAGVKRYIDLLSYHNINKLHIHLSDDEGWRIEIKSHPELAEIGGFRGGDSPVRAVYGKWDEKYGGYFTQTQMREIIAYAATRNIEIIPEIDLPGHSRNIASLHPEIRCDYPADTISTNGYDYRSAWCVAREENYPLLADILGEICELFPSPYIHVGGDEVDMSQWKQCPNCKELMQKQGMQDPHQLEDHFMARIASILQAHGKQPAVWNEAVRTGNLAQQSRVYGWENTQACLDATAKGYQTVVMPGEYFYFDMRQTPNEDGHDWAAVFDAKKCFNFEFDSLGFSDEQMSRVIGLQAAFWSEAYVSHNPEKPDYLDYMCFPRLCVLSRLAWSGNKGDWDSYYKELTAAHYDRMSAMGIRFRLFPPTIRRDKTGMVTASTDDDSEIYYTIGDGQPQRYTHAFKTLHPEQLTFVSRRGTGRSPEVRFPVYYRTITPAVTIATSMGENEEFPYTNASTYKGLSRTRRACRQQDWISYTFEQPVTCREMVLRTGNRQLPKTIITTGYAEISYDGTNFERLGNLEQGGITIRTTRPIHAVRIISTCNDNGTPHVSIQPPQIKPVLR